MYEPLDRTCLAHRAGRASPGEYMVRKDGKPFAILNATPALVQRTLAGFEMACPSASWSVERT